LRCPSTILSSQTVRIPQMVGALDLADDQAARLEAELEASELLSDPGEGDWSQWNIRVTDEAGRLVTSVSLSDMAEQYASPVAMI